MTGNQYLWGNNPYSQYKMINVETMKTLYDPCPAGYKVSPPDVYGAFLKYPIIDSPIGESGTEFWDIWRRRIFILLYLLSMGHISIVVEKIVHGKSILFLLRFAMEELMIKG